MAANNYELQCNLVRNGVLWSLLLFWFDYDYTLDESGVQASDKTNQQQVANNLAKIAVLACIALSGYGLDLHKAANGSDNGSGDASPTTGPKVIKANPAIASPSTSVYTKNAQNPLQNSNKQLAIITGGADVEARNMIAKRDSNASNKSDAISNASSNGKDENGETNGNGNARKPNDSQLPKYTVVSEAKNTIVKQVLDRLLTPYIANRLPRERSGDVRRNGRAIKSINFFNFFCNSRLQILKVLTSNTRNPYLIWDNGTRAQLVEFLETQRTTATKETFEDVAEVYNLVSEFQYDASK